MDKEEKKLPAGEELENFEMMPAQELPADIPAEVRRQLEQDLNEEATEDLKQDVREAEEEEAREAARETEKAPDPDRLTKSRLLKLLVKKQYVKLREVTEDEQPADLAELLEELDENNRLVVFRLLKKEVAAEAFTYAFLGCIAGCALGLPLSRMLYDFLIASHFAYAVWTPPAGALLVIVLFVLLSAAAAVHTPARRIRSMSVTETVNEL